MSKRLSILVCSITGREESLRRLMNSFDAQVTEDVEVLVETDDKKITTGAKRNILLERAIGDYVAFVDDDDKVSEDYVSKILKAIVASPDCCGIEGEISHIVRLKTRTRTRRRPKHERRVQTFIHSIRYDKWFEANGIYYRCPNHLNPVKRELALSVMFPDISRSEDADYSLKLRPLLKTEEYINGIIYYYFAS